MSLKEFESYGEFDPVRERADIPREISETKEFEQILKEDNDLGLSKTALSGKKGRNKSQRQGRNFIKYTCMTISATTIIATAAYCGGYIFTDESGDAIQEEIIAGKIDDKESERETIAELPNQEQAEPEMPAETETDGTENEVIYTSPTVRPSVNVLMPAIVPVVPSVIQPPAQNTESVPQLPTQDIEQPVQNTETEPGKTDTEFPVSGDDGKTETELPVEVDDGKTETELPVGEDDGKTETELPEEDDDGEHDTENTGNDENDIEQSAFSNVTISVLGSMVSVNCHLDGYQHSFKSVRFEFEVSSENGENAGYVEIDAVKLLGKDLNGAGLIKWNDGMVPEGNYTLTLKAVHDDDREYSFDETELDFTVRNHFGRE